MDAQHLNDTMVTKPTRPKASPSTRLKTFNQMPKPWLKEAKPRPDPGLTHRLLHLVLIHFLVGDLWVGLGAGFVLGFKTGVDSGFGSGAGSGGSGHSSRTGDV